MSDEKSVSELRAQVDEINMQILDLLTRRANVVSEIGKLHHEDGRLALRPGARSRNADGAGAGEQGTVQQRDDQGAVPRNFPRLAGNGRTAGARQNPRAAPFAGRAHRSFGCPTATRSARAASA